MLPFPVIDALPLGAHRLIALTDEGLFRATGVRVAFTQREGGVSEGAFARLNLFDGVGDDEGAVQRNKAIVCEAIGADPSKLVAFTQVHGTRIVRLEGEAPLPSSAEEADGALVCVPDVAVMLRSADCLLLAVVSPTGRCAVAHAGWRGAVEHIARKAALELAAHDDADPSSYNAYLGPHICASCFEVGEDVEARFRAEFGDEVISHPRHVSLSAAVTADLIAAGMSADRIADAHACTACDPNRFFSYRATGGVCGRQALVVHRALRNTTPPVLEGHSRTAPLEMRAGAKRSSCIVPCAIQLNPSTLEGQGTISSEGPSIADCR